MEAYSDSGELGSCPGVSTTISAPAVTPEDCDIKTASRLGSTTSTCSTTCQLGESADAFAFVKASDGAGLALQHMLGAPLQQDTSDYVRLCMYATQWVDSDCNPVTSLADAVGCKLSGEDFVNNPSLECYHTDGNDAAHHQEEGLCVMFDEGGTVGLSLSQLQALGTKDENTQISHKCVNEFTTTGDMTATSESWIPANSTTDHMTSVPTFYKSDGVLPNIHDFCFSFEETDYGGVESGTQKLMPSKYTIDYKIICDPLDQIELTDAGSVFGQRANVCDHENLPWSLVTCDANDDNCEPLLSNKHVHENPYDTADPSLRGTAYTFDHESNFFDCAANELIDGDTGNAFTEVPNFLNTCAHQHRSETTGDGQAYNVGCDRRLKLWVQHGFGAIYFRVETTITSSFEPLSYSAKKSEMVGFSIRATVHPTLPLFALQSSSTTEPSTEDASAGSVSLFGAQPFASMLQRSESLVRDGDFSPTARWTTEYVDCTESTQLVAVEGDATVARFDIIGVDDQQLEYSGSSRTYSRSQDFPDLTALKQLQDNLKVRSNTPWHDAYTNGTITETSGICVKMRLTVYEPSSCEFTSAVSDPSFVRVAPSRVADSTGGTIAVSSAQGVARHGENTVIPLHVQTEYANLELDSELFHFSHLEITDLGIGNEDMYFAGDFDLFNGDAASLNTANQAHYSDTVGSVKYITKPTRQATTWTTYSNHATKWLVEHPGHSWGSAELEAYLEDSFPSSRPCGDGTSGVSRSQECLSHARTTGADLFAGLFLRHRVGSPTNVKLELKIHAIDGPSEAGPYDTASHEVEFSFLPDESVRMDQGEMHASPMYMKENAMQHVTLHAGGVRIPTVRRSSYMDGTTLRDVEICVYTHDAQSAQADQPASDASNPQYKNVLCSSTDGLVTDGDDVAYMVPATGSKFIRHSCPHRAGYRLRCEAASNNKFTESRIKLHEFALSDVSILTIPGGKAYQPAGNNVAAFDSQWYRAEPCDTAANIESIYWCDNNDDSGVFTTGLPSNSVALMAEAGASCASSESSANFWKVTLKPDRASMAEDEICIQGLSDFNTEQTANVDPVVLEMSYSVVETTVLHDGSSYDAFSSTVRGTAESKIRMTVESVRNRADSSVLQGGKKWVMERPSRDLAAYGTWADVGVALAPGVADCNGEKKAFELCLDRFLFSESVSNFNDQFMGRMQIQCQVRSTRGQHEWQEAGGMFAVPVIADSGVTQIEGYYNASLDVKSAYHATDPDMRSQCTFESNPNETVSKSSCTFATNPHTVEDWNQSSATYYNRVMVDGDAYWSTDVDLIFPSHWKNVEFNCSVAASNEDREHLPDKCLAHNELWEKVDGDSVCPPRNHMSDIQYVTVAINETSRLPYLFVEVDLIGQPNASCTGHASHTGCTGKGGVKAQKRSDYKTPEIWGTALNPSLGNHATHEMMSINVVANRMYRMRVVMGSYGTDKYEDYVNPPDGHADYYEQSARVWNPKAAGLQAIGSKAYLTIESKHVHTTVAGEADANLNFCVWVCPVDKPSCAMSELLRYKPLQDSVEIHTTNENSGMYDEDLLAEELSDPAHLTCPEAEGPGQFRPGSRYSIECLEDGLCHELQDIYISYPQSETRDDLLEFSAVERGDSRGPDYWKNVSISTFVYMTPSVHNQQVTLDKGWDENSYTVGERSQTTADNRALKYRLVLRETDFEQNGIDFFASFDNQEGEVTGELNVNMSTAILGAQETKEFCVAGDAADVDCLVYPYPGGVQSIVAMSSGHDILSATAQWADGESRADSKTMAVRSVENSTVWHNTQCEPAKQMLMRLRATGGNADNADGFVLVTVTDDDFYGEVRMASCSGSVCSIINENHTFADRNVASNISWEAWSNVHATPTFEIERSKSSPEDPALSAAIVVLTVNTQDLRPIDWSIKVVDLDSYIETIVPVTDVIEKSDNNYDVHIALPEFDALQRVRVSFESTGRVDTCGVLGASDVKFTLSDLRSVSGASQVVSTCPRAVLPYSQGKPSSITVSMQSSDDNAALLNDRHPWAIEFDSYSEEPESSSYPVQYDSGVKNTIVIEEAESMRCRDPTDAACASRTARMPMCLRPQPGMADATGAMAGPLGTFVVGVEDATTSALSIGHNYRLRCVSESTDQSASTVECKRISQLGYNDTDTNGDTMTKTLICHDDYTTFAYENTANGISNLTPEKHDLYCNSQPTWLQYHISTAIGGGHDLQCGNANAKPQFELTFFNVEEPHMSYDVNVVMRNKPDTDGAATCSTFSTPNLKFRVLQHLPIFVEQGYKLSESHVTTFENTVIHDISNGAFSFAVSDQYFTTPESETTFVNHGFGECPEKGTAWERHDINWLADGAPTQGTCDSLDLGAMRAAVTDPTDKIGSFRELFGELTTSLTTEEYADTSIDLASPLAYKDRDTPGIVRTMQRSASPGSDPSDGYSLLTETTLGAIQACKTHTGGDVLEVANDGETTTYSFYAHVSKITAQHADNANWAAHTTRCSQRKYVFSASNRIMAITGLTTPGASGDKVYVHQMGHSKSPGVCASADTCVDTIGPKNSCRSDSVGYLEALEYTVHIDRKVTVQTNSLGQETRMHYAVSEQDFATDIVVDDNNCYGASVKSVQVSYPVNEAGDADMNLVRSSITFITGCQDLRDAAGAVAGNAFSTCQSDPTRRMDFSFNASLYACSSPANLVRSTGPSTTPADPKSVHTCTELNVQPYSMNMEYTHKPTKIETSATQTTSTYILRGPPHHNARTPAEVAVWKANNKLSRGSATISEGEQVNVAMCTTGAEDVSTLKIADVAMTTSKLPCLLEPYTLPAMVGAGWPACTKDNMLVLQTHSPLVFFVFGVTLDGTTACSTRYTGGAHCQPGQLSSNASNPIPEYGLFDEQRWETFINLELQCIHGSAQTCQNAPTAEYQALFSGSVFSQQIVGLSPFKTSPKQMFSGGALTPYASAMYGSAFSQVSNEQIQVVSTGADGTAATQTVNAVFPEANGVGSCATASTICPWTFLERTARGTVSSTCDVWHMNLPSLRKGERYVFSLVSEQRQINGGQTRRLLAVVSDQESANPFDVTGFGVVAAKVGSNSTNTTTDSSDDDWKSRLNTFGDYLSILDDHNRESRSFVGWRHFFMEKDSSTAESFYGWTCLATFCFLAVHKIIVVVWILIIYRYTDEDKVHKQSPTERMEYVWLCLEGTLVNRLRIFKACEDFKKHRKLYYLYFLCIPLIYLELATGSFFVIGSIELLAFMLNKKLENLQTNHFNVGVKTEKNPQGEKPTEPWTLMHMKAAVLTEKTQHLRCYSIACGYFLFPLLMILLNFMIIANAFAVLPYYLFMVYAWKVLYHDPEKQKKGSSKVEMRGLMMAEPASATEGKFYIP